AFPVLRHPRETVSDAEFLLGTVGRLWTRGIEADVDAIREGGAPRRRIPLPTYPFEHKRHWIERADALPTKRTDHAPRKRALAKKSRVEDWFYLPSHRRSVVGPARKDLGPFLVLSNGAGLGDRLAERLAPDGVVRVTPGRDFQRFAED